MKPEEITNHFDSFIRRFPELSFVTSIIKMTELNGATYTPEQKMEQYENAIKLIQFNEPHNMPKSSTSSHMTQLYINQAEAGDTIDLADYVYDDGDLGDEYEGFSAYRAVYGENRYEENETREFRLPKSLWDTFGKQDRISWIKIRKSSRANIIEYFTTGSVSKGDDNDGNDANKKFTNRKPSSQLRRVSKTKTVNPKRSIHNVSFDQKSDR